MPTDSPPLRICIDVPEMEAALRFYTQGLGLSVGRRFDEAFVELRLGAAAIDLLVKKPGSKPFPDAPPQEGRHFSRHWSPVHLDLVVQNLDEAVERACSHGAVVETPIRAAPYGRIALLADPFGHGFCLLEMNAQGYDALVGGASDGL